MSRDVNIGQLRCELLEARGQCALGLGVRDEARIEQAADVMDQIQAAEMRELALRTLDRNARQLREIDETLWRIDAGDYGICVDCQEDIATKRLRAVPSALRCLKCQERFDQEAVSDEEIDVRRLSNAA